MKLALGDTQALVQKTARDYATRVLLPQAASIDRNEAIPREVLKGLADLGLMAVNVPAALGGSAAGATSYALAMQEIARGCASTAVTMAVTNMVGEVIAAFGTEAQRARCCPRLASGEWPAGSFALSEAGAGSDPGGMQTTARPEGDGWVIERHQAVDHERHLRGRLRRVGADGAARYAPGRPRDLVLPRRGRHARAQGGQGRGQDGHPRVEHVGPRARRLPRARGRAPRAGERRASRSR